MTTEQHDAGKQADDGRRNGGGKRYGTESPLPVRIILWIIAAIAAIPVIAIIYLLTFDWNGARPRAGAKAGVT